MDPWKLLVWTASAGFVLCLLPQLVRTLKIKRADDISLAFILIVLAASALMLPYMVHTGEFVFAGAQLANIIVWGIVLYYRLRPGLPVATTKSL